MADDKTKQGYQDRDRVNGSERYEVDYFARENGITPEQTRELIRQHGNSRSKLEEEARKLKGR